MPRKPRPTLAGALLLLAALSIAALGEGAAGLPSTFQIKPVEPTEPAEPAQPAQPADLGRIDHTIGLQHDIKDLGGDPDTLDRQDRRDIRDDISDEVDDVEADLDDIEIDLEEREDEIDLLEENDRIEDSRQLKAAEDKLAELEAELRGLRHTLNGISMRARFGADLPALLAEVRGLGRAIGSLERKVTVDLDALIEEAEDLR